MGPPPNDWPHSIWFRYSVNPHSWYWDDTSPNPKWWKFLVDCYVISIFCWLLIWLNFNLWWTDELINSSVQQKKTNQWKLKLKIIYTHASTFILSEICQFISYVSFFPHLKKNSHNSRAKTYLTKLMTIFVTPKIIFYISRHVMPIKLHLSVWIFEHNRAKNTIFNFI